MSPACSKALGLPEIVAAILEYLVDAQDLFSALQVNTLWSDEATTILWREEPPMETVSRINDVERLQYYADKITSLAFDYGNSGWNSVIPEEARQKLRSLRFPRLTRIHAEKLGSEDEHSLLHYLQPKLQALKCSDAWPISDRFLMQIEGLCPALRSFSLSSFLGTTQTCDLVRFLNSMPSLTSIHLGQDLENIISDQLHVHLASRPNLLVLEIFSKTFTGRESQKISAAVADPYPKLIELSCYSSYRDFNCLSRHLHGLRVLQLDLDRGKSEDILFTISRCTNLIRMKLTFAWGDAPEVPAEGILSVAKNCPHLRVFDLGIPTSMHKYLPIGGRTITDDIIKQVATYLPAMTTFKLIFPTHISTTALLHLGDLCMGLTECCLIGDFNMEELCRPKVAPVLPQLRKLRLSKVSNKISPEQAKSIHYQAFPNLRSLEFFYGRDFETGIGDWRNFECSGVVLGAAG